MMASENERGRVAGVLAASASGERRLGGHPYRAEIMQRAADLLRDSDAEIARLTRELEEARERERGVRSAVIRAVAALARLAPRLDPREEAEWVPRGSVVEIATRLKDEVLALSTPQEASDGTTRWYCEYGCGCVLDSRAARYHDCRRPASDGGEVRGDAPAGATLYRRRCGWCGAYEGTVDPKEPCAKDEIGYIGPHQFEVLEAVVSGSGSPPGEGERANCRCAPGAPWRSDGATCPDWPGCGNPDWRPATPQEASGAD